MIRHVWTVYCREVLTDKETNSVSTIQALESLHFGTSVDENVSGQSQLVPFESKLITLWARREWDTPVTSTARIRFLGPDGSELLNSTVLVNLEEHLRIRSTANLSNLGIKGSGFYEWVVDRAGSGGEDEWVEEARIPLQVEIKWAGRGEDAAEA